MSLINAQEAFDSVAQNRQPIGRASPFVCPYPDCGAYALHYWGVANNLYFEFAEGGGQTRSATNHPIVALAACEACAQEVIFVDGKLAWPRTLPAPAPSADLPQELAADFEEARQIHLDSPRGAAALLRLVVQKLLPIIGANKSNINEAIGELVAAGTIVPAIQQALDSVRVIGNEAVHPGELDLRDDAEIVNKLFHLINFIVAKAITEPREVAQIFGGLPAGKRDQIARRDGGKAAP